MKNKLKRKSLSIKEAINQLNENPEYRAKRASIEKLGKQNSEQFKVDSAPLMRELANSGFVYNTPRDLRYSGLTYTSAVPILLKWLPRIENIRVKEDIVRTLSVPWAKPNAAPTLVREFRMADPSQVQYKWAIGNGLSIVADDTVEDDIIELVMDRRHGKAREMLAVSLGNMKDPRAVDTLLGLLKDDQIAGHAIMGLRRLNVSSAKSLIEPFLSHPQAWIRTEAKKALAQIDREVAKRRVKLVTRRVQ